MSPATPTRRPRRASDAPILLLVAASALSACGDVGPAATDGAPEVTILEPHAGLTVTEGTEVTFRGTATDAEDGDMSHRIEWRAEPDHFLGRGASVTAVPPVGVHLISARVWDSRGHAGAATLGIEVKDDLPPTLTIVEPADGITVPAGEGETVTLRATATDAEDGDLSGDVVWRSFSQGALGTGASIAAVLEMGVHVVLATVEDARGQQASAQVEVRVGHPLPNGQARTGTVVGGEDGDVWMFEAEAGELLVVGVGVTASSGPFRARLELEDPEGRIIAVHGGEKGALINRTAPRSGSYTAIVSDADGSTGVSADYRITALRLPATGLPVDSTEAGTLANGESAPGTIEAGDLDVWTFEAVAGDYLAASVGELGAATTFDPWVVLVPPAEAVPDAGWSRMSSFETMQAPVTGTYTVVVGAWMGELWESSTHYAPAGEYSLTMVRLPGEPAIPPGDDGGELVNGAARPGAYDDGDLDVFTLEADAGDRVAVSIAGEPGSGMRPRIVLVDPDGLHLAGGGRYEATALIDVTAPKSGTYAVLATDAHGMDAPATYAVRLLKTPGDFVVPAGDEGGAAVNGVSVTGELPPGDLDPWTVEAEAGDRIAAYLAEAPHDPSVSPWITVLDPDGEVLSSLTGARVAWREHTAGKTGTYTFRVGDVGSVGGTYVMTAVRVPGDFTVAEGDEGGPLTDDAEHAGAARVGDVDPWTFTAAAGETVTLEVRRKDGSSEIFPWIQLLGPGGEVIDAGWAPEAMEITAGIATAGTHTVLIRNYDAEAEGPGEYVLTLTR